MTYRQKIMSDLEGLTFDDWHMFHCDTDVQGIAIDALELLKKQEWISVKDRLPKVYNEYLAVVDGEVEEVAFNPTLMEKQPWSHCIAEGFEFLKNDSVTHWMPLPKTPEVKQDD